MRATLGITVPTGVNPLEHNTSRSKRVMFREFMLLLKAVVGQGLKNRLDDSQSPPSITVGTARANATVTCATVVNGNTVTLNGQALTATQHYATNTITCTQSGIDVDDAVTFNFGGSDVVFTAKATENTAAGQFAQITSDDAVATSLAACINANTTCAAVLLATVASNIVTVRALASGTAPNSWTLSSSDAQLAIGGATFAGGAAIGNNEFDFVRSDILDAASLAYAINNSTTSIVSDHLRAGTRSATITLSGCTAGEWVEVAGVRFVAVADTTPTGTLTDFYIGGTDTQDATALKSAINAHPVTKEKVFASSSSGIVTVREIPPESDTAVRLDKSGAHISLSANACAASAVCFIAAKDKGYHGNAVTIASSGSTLAIGGSASRLSGGTATTYTFP